MNTLLLVLSSMAILLTPAPNAALAQDAAPGWAGFIFRQAPPEGPAGVLVRTVQPGSPAQEAGLRPGDVIVTINGAPLIEAAALAGVLRVMPPGTRLQFQVLRGTERVSVDLVMGVKRLDLLAETALARGRAWLLARQREDGAWQHFRAAEGMPGVVNTALALMALSGGEEAGVEAASARALAFLLAHERPEVGGIGVAGDPVGYVNYATAMTIVALARVGGEGHGEAAARLADFLCRRQLAEDFGFDELSWQHGAWDFYDANQRDLLRADISITAFVLEGLHAAGVKPDHPVLERARGFLGRCQNYREGVDDAADDGGFTFNPRDSKAGMRRDAGGAPLALISYGSATCEGLRSLINAGLAPVDPRVAAARRWIGRHFDVTANTNFPSGGRVAFDRGIYFYYLHGLAKALAACGDPALAVSGGAAGIRWADALVDRLVSFQAEDGSWASGENLMNEDNPLVSTPLALEALQSALPYVTAP